MHLFLSFIFLLIGCLVNLLFDGTNINANDIAALPFTTLSLICILQFFLIRYKGKLGRWLSFIIILRYVILLWNVYGREIMLLPGVGTDTEGFYQSASSIAKDPLLLQGSVYGSWYSKYLGICFMMSGSSYLLGSFYNFLYGVFSIVILGNILSLIEGLSLKAFSYAMLLFSIEPIYMILCSSLRRESLMAFLVILSFEKMFQWSLHSKSKDAVLAIVFLLLASIIHSAVISIGLGYIIALLFYNPHTQRYEFKRNTVIVAVLLYVAIAIIFSRYANIFLNRIQYDDERILFRRLSRSVGDAAYLKNVKITNIQTALLYMPIKLIYYLFSPMPWDWRGIADVIAFVLDSSVFIGLTVILVRNLHGNYHYRIKNSFFISMMCCALIYAGGSQNAANAMRHRNTLLGVYIILVCFFLAGKNNTEAQNDTDHVF